MQTHGQHSERPRGRSQSHSFMQVLHVGALQPSVCELRLDLLHSNSASLGPAGCNSSSVKASATGVCASVTAVRTLGVTVSEFLTHCTYSRGVMSL